MSATRPGIRGPTSIVGRSFMERATFTRGTWAFGSIILRRLHGVSLRYTSRCTEHGAMPGDGVRDLSGVPPGDSLPVPLPGIGGTVGAGTTMEM